MDAPNDTDERTPSPPFGYSRPCELDRDAQVRVVAQFHAHRIRPNRIAYRMGIDIAFVEALIAGEVEAERFAHLVDGYRRQRYRDRLRESSAQSGSRRFELQQEIEREFQRDSEAGKAVGAQAGASRDRHAAGVTSNAKHQETR